MLLGISPDLMFFFTEGFPRRVPCFHLEVRRLFGHTEVLRTYSSGALWGKELTETSPVAPLFNYLPQAGASWPRHAPRRIVRC